MSPIRTTLSLVLGMAFAACSDGERETDGPQLRLDGGPEDVVDTSTDAVPACKIDVIGKLCTKNGGECGKANPCFLTDDKGNGICTCACTPDDSTTPLVNEDTCPGKPKIVCSAKKYKWKTTDKRTVELGACFQLCTPQYGKNECKGGAVCSPQSIGVTSLYGKPVCLFSKKNAGYGCAKDADCQVTTGVKCSIKKVDCPPGSSCLAWRTSGDTGICRKPGTCDTASGLCQPVKTGKKAKIGDPCKGDVDCGDGQYCMMEYDEAKDMGKVVAAKTCKSNSDCCSSSCTNGRCDKGAPCTIQYRNGYCSQRNCAFSKTMTGTACPPGSHCNTLYLVGLCQKSCLLTSKTGADACRGNAKDKMGDYECRSWDALASGSSIFAQGPVCDFGPVVGCSWLKAPAGSTSTLSCASLGTYSGTTNDNTTRMGCRDLTNKMLRDKYSKAGWCFDDTASGCVGTRTDCSGTCVDLQTDAANCGACGTKCTATQKCTAGKCA